MSDQSGEPQSSGEPLSPSEPRSDVDVDVLRLKRHAILSTALPFPKLDWRNQKNDAENLKEIRDYSESLANSTLDWYLAHHKSKKRKAKTLHFVIFLFVGLAAIPPLLKVGFANGLQSACEYCDWLNNHTGELALVLLGIAGVAKLWDSNAGYTVDWMRFITTAVQISRELSKFQFDWDKFELARRDRPVRSAVAGEASNQSSDPAQTAASPTEQQIKLAQDFCEQIFKMVCGEIVVWADEFKKRYDRVASHSSPEK
jgi:hypothetical protein